jgi:intracellular sulfur oxidation DsrE/DsrF family protein
MRPLRDLHDVPHCALGREHRIGRRRRNGARRPGNAKDRRDAQEDEANGDICTLEFHRSLAQSMLTGGATMRRTLFVVMLAMLSFGFVRAERHPYRVVFDLTSRDSLDQRAVLRWIREVGTASPNAQMEVVMYAKGIELVMPERSTYLADVKDAMKSPNVTFKVCAIALKNNGVDKSQLLPGVQVVPDGIYELVSKQQDHWGYIKVMH